MLEKRLTVAVLLETNKSRIRTGISRQQGAKRTTSKDEAGTIAVETESICPVFLFLIQNGQMVIEQNPRIRG